MKRQHRHPSVTRLTLGLTLALAPALLMAQDGGAKENWALEHQEILNHPEAELLVRHGSINNLGFGWPAGFDPFSGASTPIHHFPWPAHPKAAKGTDRILVVSSYKGTPPQGQDGYTGTTRRPGNLPVPIPITFKPPKLDIHAAVLQIFVDDFQAPVWGSKFQVTMNGWRVPELESILNSLNQSGPIGKLVTYQLPTEVVKTLHTGKLTITVDDPTTGAGDGYAFDFFRLLINPRGSKYQGTLTGRVSDEASDQPIAGATVSAGGVVKTQTAKNGTYKLEGVPAGLATLAFSAKGYQRKTIPVDLLAGHSQVVNAKLKAIDLETSMHEEAALRPRLHTVAPEDPKIDPKPSVSPAKDPLPSPKDPLPSPKDPDPTTRKPEKKAEPTPVAATDHSPPKAKDGSAAHDDPPADDAGALPLWATTAAAGGVLLLALLAGTGFVVYRKFSQPAASAALPPQPVQPAAFAAVPTVEICLVCGQKLKVFGMVPGTQFKCPHCGTVRVK